MSANLFEEQLRLEQLAKRIGAETRARLAPFAEEDERRMREDDAQRTQWDSHKEEQ